MTNNNNRPTYRPTYKNFAEQPLAMTTLSADDLSSTVHQWDFLQAPLFTPSTTPVISSTSSNSSSGYIGDGFGCEIDLSPDNQTLDMNEVPILIIGALGIYLLLSNL